VVLIQTYKTSKISFIYVLIGLLLFAVIADLVSKVLQNWTYFGGFEEQSEKLANFRIAKYSLYYLNFVSFSMGHWIFSFKYLQVAYLFSVKLDNRPVYKHRKLVHKIVNLIAWSVIIIVFSVYLYGEIVWSN